MKLRYLFSFALASSLLFAGCNETVPETLENIQMSKTYLSIPEDGGSAEITITATEDWQFVINETWPEVVKFADDENGKAYKAKHDEFGFLTNPENEIESKTPSWLSASVLSGKAGETKIVFTAEATSGGRELDLAIKAGERNKQFLKVRQGSMAPVSATCKEVIDGPDGKTYRVKGVCTSIVNTSYGNWYLKDDTGEIYIYGTLDEKGAEKNFLSLGIEVGDSVAVEGPKTTYNSTIELVNVTVLSVKKSLVKVITEEQTLPKDGGEFEVKVAYKGDGMFPSVPAEYRSWVSVADIKNIKGVPSKLEQNPADTAVVTVSLVPNTGGDRKGAISFESSSSSVTYNFTQEGAIIDATVSDFLAAEEGETMYRITGVIKTLKVSSQYHNADITVAGGTGETVLLYRTVTKEGNIEDLGLQEGDLVTVVGKRSSYKGVPQMAQGGVLESYERYDAATVAEFLAAEENDKVWQVTGKITEIKNVNAQYNNAEFTIEQDGNSVKIYRMTTFDKSDVTMLNLEVGGTITVAGKRSSYKEVPQMAAGCVCLSYEAPSAGGGDTPDPSGDEYETTIAYTGGDNFYDDGVATINGTEGVKVLKFGTSKKQGTATFTLPAGTKSVVLYGVAWDGTTCDLTFSFGSFEAGKVSFSANKGAKNNSPYTINVTDSDRYEVAISAGSEMPATVTSSGRCIIWGVKAVVE